MDFFAHQDRARARSRRLVALFLLALVAVVVAVDLVAYAGWWLLAAGLKPPRFFLETNTFVTLLIVVGGAWIETHRLRDGASALAARLGARPLDDGDPLHRRLRDVAEEAAIGAGVPVPALYVLDDPSINALAAGERPALAAVMVTRGALERLERAELQGVVAHEIAHIVGGDSAANAQLAGALYGLLSLHLLGSRMLASAFEPMGVARRAVPVRIVLAVAGLLISVVGWLGVAAAQLLRAGISRQREFLADAMAVQFTRDRDGLGGALRRIAGEKSAGLRADYAPLVAHFLLAAPQGGDALHTHPPLAERIRRLYGRRMPPIRPGETRHARGAAEAAGRTAEAPASPRSTGSAAEACARTAPEALDCSAAAYLETVPYAPAARTGGGPEVWLAGAIPWVDERAQGSGPGSPRSVRASADGVPHPAERGEREVSPAARLVERIRAASLGYESAGCWLEALVGGSLDAARECRDDPGVRAALAWVLSPAGSALRVPLLELLLARVRRWSSAHRRDLLDRCRHAVERDGRVDSSEWVYYTLARHRLLPASPGAQRARRASASRGERSRALAALFAMASAVGEASARNTRDALADAAVLLDIPPPAATPDEVGTGELTRALDVLLGLPPLSKPILLRTLRRLARTPGEANYDAFLRAVAAAIDCPAPRAAPAVTRPALQSLRAAIGPSVAPVIAPSSPARSSETSFRRDAGADALSV